MKRIFISIMLLVMFHSSVAQGIFAQASDNPLTGCLAHPITLIASFLGVGGGLVMTVAGGSMEGDYQTSLAARNSALNEQSKYLSTTCWRSSEVETTEYPYWEPLRPACEACSASYPSCADFQPSVPSECCLAERCCTSGCRSLLSSRSVIMFPGLTKQLGLNISYVTKLLGDTSRICPIAKNCSSLNESATAPCVEAFINEFGNESSGGRHCFVKHTSDSCMLLKHLPPLPGLKGDEKTGRILIGLGVPTLCVSLATLFAAFWGNNKESEALRIIESKTRP